MVSPIQKYKELNKIDNIKDIAYDTLFTKYIIRNERGEDKLWEIDSTDQEGLIVNLNGGLPIPGMIYTFMYNMKKSDIININNEEFKYKDKVPLVFCLYANTDDFVGINLNMLPDIERLAFLETYYNIYKNFFKDIEKQTQNNEIAINSNYLQNIGSEDGKDILNLFSKISGSNFKYGYRKYKLSNIVNFRMIEYVEWIYIPFYSPKHAFKLLNQKQIQALYYKSL